MIPESDLDDILFTSWARHHLPGYDHATRKLDGMRQLFARAGISLAPDDLPPCIVVTGSKGKGSTAILAARLLQGAGLRVGLLTSPHYLSHRERVRVDGRAIPPADYARIVSELAPHIQAVDAALPEGEYLSPTGLFLAVALRYFAAQQVQAMVLEVGRGGRFDDVNLVPHTVSVITHIDHEHHDRLGPTLAHIAWHKAGIIWRAGQAEHTVVGGLWPPEARRVIEWEAARVGARVQAASTRSERVRENFTLLTAYPTLSVARLKLTSPALYVRLNLVLAVRAVMTFFPALDLAPVAPLLTDTVLPGRVQKLAPVGDDVGPVVWLDGAINGEGMRLFKASAGNHARSPAPRVLVTALPTDKDTAGFFGALPPDVAAIILTRAGAAHLHYDDRALRLARRSHPDVIEQPDPAAAFEQATARAGPAGTVWIVGTQSLLRAALMHWRIDLETLDVPGPAG